MRIGVLTAGGDAPGLNAVIRALVKSCRRRNWHVIGFAQGFEGLLSGAHRVLNEENTHGILHLGGTVLGTVSRGHFPARTAEGELRRLDPRLLIKARETCEGLRLHALICIGGDGSLATAQELFQAGVPVIGVPKTIDNDLAGTAVTLGFDSAAAFATDAVGRLHSTADAHGRVILVEVMGRHSGWIALHAALTGGADFALIPEVAWDFPGLLQKIQEREASGRHFTIGVVAEGAHWPRGGLVVQSSAVAETGEVRLGGIGVRLAAELEARCGKECRCVVLGHLLRGGAPTNFDRLLGTRFGVRAVELAAERRFGMMVSYQPPEVGFVPIQEAIRKRNTIPPDSSLIASARALGIALGDT